MYPSNHEFLISDEILANVDEYYGLYYAALNLINEQSEEEAHRILSAFENVSNNLETPLYLLEIARRIFVEESTDYGSIITITAYLNKLFLSRKQIEDTCKSNPDYYHMIVSSILYLLPYAANYFQITNDLSCFTNLYFCLLQVFATYKEENQELINRYIDILINPENPYQNIIGILFSSRFDLNEPVAEKLIIYITTLLENLPTSDLNDYLIEIQYQKLFNDLHEFLERIIQFQKIDPNIFFRSINGFFSIQINHFKETREHMTNTEIKLTKEIINFIKYTIATLKSNVSCTNKQINSNIINALFQMIYTKILSLNSASFFSLSSILSYFLFVNFEYFTPQLFQRNPNYFVNLIFHLSISPSNMDDVFEPEESFFSDFYDLSFDNRTSYSSNRQNIPYIIGDFITKFDNTDIICAIAQQLSKYDINNVREHHFYLLSAINLVVEEMKISDSEILTILYELLVNYLQMGSTLVSENKFAKTEKFMFTFTYFLLITSSFYIIKINREGQMNGEIINLYNEQLGNLMLAVSGFDEEHPDDDFYRSYFTFFCMISNKLIEIDSLSLQIEEVFPFVEKFFNFCITNDSIYLMDQIAEKESNIELIAHVFNQYLVECHQDLDKYKKLNKLTNLSGSDNGGDEENDQKDEDENNKEEEEDDDNDVKQILVHFGSNVSHMSSILKRVDDLTIFDLERILEFASKIANCDTGNEDFIDEIIELFSALFYVIGDVSEFFKFYYNVILSGEHGTTCEYSIPLSRVISKRYNCVDQELYINILVYMKDFIENWVTTEPGETGESERKLITTKDFIPISTLISRLLEIGATDQLQIPQEDFNLFLSLAFETIPTEEDCDDDEAEQEYNKEDHELAACILKLASYLSSSEIDQEELLEFLSKLVSEGLIVCQEMRYLIIFLIDNAIDNKEDEQIVQLRQLCLNNEINKDENAVRSYFKNYDLLVADEKHPIFYFYPIENFVFDE